MIKSIRVYGSLLKKAKAIEKTIPCKRVGIAVIGLEVPHAHIHLIPLQSVEDINFSKPKLKIRFRYDERHC